MGCTEGPLSREKLRDLRSLDSAKIRKRKRLCIVEGSRSLVEAERTGNLLYLVKSDEKNNHADIPDRSIRALQAPCYTIAHRDFREVSDVKSGTNLLGVARIPENDDTQGLKTIQERSLLLY